MFFNLNPSLLYHIFIIHRPSMAVFNNTIWKFQLYRGWIRDSHPSEFNLTYSSMLSTFVIIESLIHRTNEKESPREVTDHVLTFQCATQLFELIQNIRLCWFCI